MNKERTTHKERQKERNNEITNTKNKQMQKERNTETKTTTHNDNNKYGNQKEIQKGST